ncbi:MAG TPA: type 1 glutamine amidotransferase domain-containing protein [Candidatus Angelobacter sp.]
MASVVMVVSGANVWTMKNARPHPTGFWSEEFVTPHRKFTEAGFKVTIAAPCGVSPTVDPLSFNLAYNNNDANRVNEQQDYLKRLGSALTSPMRVEDINPDKFDVIFLVGGHGPMQDMAVYSAIGAVLVTMLDNSRKIVAAVCHGPAGFFTASRADGTWAFGDRQLTGFSNEEETQAGFAGNAPWLLEDRLRVSGGRGARYIAKAAWTPHAVVDGNLITGQQNYSAGVTADAILKQLAANV